MWLGFFFTVNQVEREETWMNILLLGAFVCVCVLDDKKEFTVERINKKQQTGHMYIETVGKNVDHMEMICVEHVKPC